MANNGYFGKVLWIDLTEKKFEEKAVSDEIYRKYIGGYGLGCKLIYDNMNPKQDPLSEDSLLGFFPGLLTGSTAPFTGRYMVVGKSPLTGTWGDANSGGTFGPEIKKCGYDGIVIKGKSESPTYVSIIEGDKSFKDASELWGKDIIEAENLVKEKHGKFIKTAGIGQAGEKLSRISGVVNDKGRIAARSGLGATMGSKNLKLIALRGREKLSYHDKEKFQDLVKTYHTTNPNGKAGKLKRRLIGQIPKIPKLLSKLGGADGGPPGLISVVYRNFGTSFANTLSAISGDSPVKNWDGIGLLDFPTDQVKNISTHVFNNYKKREYGCYSCPIQCGGICEVPELDLEETHLPEYETCCSFGTLLLNDDPMSIFTLNELCNRAGLDTISTGATVAFAIECFEKGILTKDDTDGLELTWGNSEAIIEVVKKIIKREGIGDVLADGVKIASEKIGKGSEKYAIHSLGEELPMHDPKYFKSLGFSYAFDPTPGRHTTASVDFNEVGAVDKFEPKIKLPEDRKENEQSRLEAQRIFTGFHQVMCSTGLCMFSTSMGQYPFIDIINAFTGWDMDGEELITTGLRIQTLRQAFTVREGVIISENTLPGRSVGNPPFEKGPHEGVTIQYRDFYDDFCKLIGWNPKNGYPLKETLKELDLDFAIKDLY
ncbi:MAG: Tungsten-containing aldehyde ferredoxin oxidoreductase [Promethearchaeota archaeon]|nr:MAG: Tungsten-containing aldehyde ferredoxin oxidoreductase [Candidatus Lokiarchaeota archaeon]